MKPPHVLIIMFQEYISEATASRVHYSLFVLFVSFNIQYIIIYILV